MCLCCLWDHCFFPDCWSLSCTVCARWIRGVAFPFLILLQALLCPRGTGHGCSGLRWQGCTGCLQCGCKTVTPDTARSVFCALSSQDPLCDFSEDTPAPASVHQRAVVSFCKTLQTFLGSLQNRPYTLLEKIDFRL